MCAHPARYHDWVRRGRPPISRFTAGGALLALLGLGCPDAPPAPDGDDGQAESESESESESEETGEDKGDPCAPRPAAQFYSDCTGETSCPDPVPICASPTGIPSTEGPAQCTALCTLDFECPGVFGCAAEPTCLISADGPGACVLRCESDADCPGEMTCIEDVTDGVSNFLCF